MFGNQDYSWAFTPAKPGQNLSIPEAKTFSYGVNRGHSLEIPNQNPSPLGCGHPQSIADRLASLNLPGLVEKLGMQNQVTRVSVANSGQSMTEEQAVGAEALARYNAQREENARKAAPLIERLRRMGIVDSARLIEERE